MGEFVKNTHVGFPLVSDEQLSESTEKKQKDIVQRKVKKKTRVVKQDFKHVLLYSTLKCVKGEVCDIDYSNNGKFLATCSTGRSNLFVRFFCCDF